jgi:hypothetical protein
MKSKMRQCKMVQASRMSDLSTLIDKFRRIGAARAKGDMRGARKLFRTIKVSDFPPMAAFSMSHGLLCEPNDALFFIDHDWDNHGGGDWCNCFISDVIGALLRTSVPKGQTINNVLPLEKSCAKIGSNELEQIPETKIIAAITDLENRVGEVARAIKKAYDRAAKERDGSRDRT